MFEHDLEISFRRCEGILPCGLQTTAPQMRGTMAAKVATARLQMSCQHWRRLSKNQPRQHCGAHRSGCNMAVLRRAQRPMPCLSFAQPLSIEQEGLEATPSVRRRTWLQFSQGMYMLEAWAQPNTFSSCLQLWDNEASPPHELAPAGRVGRGATWIGDFAFYAFPQPRCILALAQTNPPSILFVLVC